eukprot:s56_g8.t1
MSGLVSQRLDGSPGGQSSRLPQTCFCLSGCSTEHPRAAICLFAALSPPLVCWRLTLQCSADLARQYHLCLSLGFTVNIPVFVVALGLCMGYFLRFFLVIIIVGGNYSYDSATFEKAESFGEACLVSTPSWYRTLDLQPAPLGAPSFVFPSFYRSNLPLQDSQPAKSPRQRPKAKRAARKAAVNVPPPEPEWEFEATAPTSASTHGSASSTTTEAQQLRELVSALKKSEMEVSADVQAVLNRVTVITPKEATKLMHAATDRLSNARDRLQQARTARTNMHKNWGKFIADAVKRWQAHGERFTREDAELMEAIETATAAFQAARNHHEETKTALAEFDNVIEQVQEVSDEEVMNDTTADVASNIKELQTSLARLCDCQDDGDAPVGKKQRREEPEVPMEDSKNSASKASQALQPFGAGHK